MAEPFKLIIEDDEGRRSVVPIELGDVSIGRLEGNTIRLNERNVSRHHARISADNGQILVEDLDSYNGLFLNGTRIAGRQELREGDLLRIGDFHLELRGEGMQRRSEETTQRTLMPDLESTQPEIHMRESAKPAPTPPPAPPPAAPAPQERVEPTAIIRVEHIGDVEDSRSKAGVLSGEKPKLVCVSTNFAGKEFEITKTEVVIGRTEDNDIQIDHRSVSRHHAKIVVSGKSYKVIDLKSANGTLVNGEQYAQLALKHGDLIELGHVKCRFVPPGGSYSLTLDEQAAVKSAQSGGSGIVAPLQPSFGDGHLAPAGVLAALRRYPLMAAAAGAAMMGLLLLVIWFVASDGADAPPPIERIATPDAAAVEPPLAGALATPEKLMSTAKEYLGERSWVKAIRRLDLVLEKEPEQEEALALRQQAEAELKAQASFDAANQAMRESTWGDAWNALSSIPAKSVYATDAAPLREQVKGALVGERVTQARAALEAGELDTADELVAEIESIDASAGDLADLKSSVANARKISGNKRQAKDRKKPTAPVNGAKNTASLMPPKELPPPKEQPPPAPPKPVGDPAVLYKDGIAALQGGDMTKAIDQLSKCVQADRAYCLCYRAMGIAYARSGNGPKAARYYKLYLKYCPTAKDADQVDKLLQAYEGK